MKLVESGAMASVKPPMPTYDMQVPSKMIKEGKISEAQLEQVLYAGQAHSETVKDINGRDVTKGYYIGDGTGVGKTAEIGGIIADNWQQGRKRHILISKDKKLFDGAKREFARLGIKGVTMHDLSKTKSGADIDAGKGVMFSTYSTLAMTPKDNKKSRIEQLVDWVGEDFDGTLIFDEAHLAGNAVATKGKRGTKAASKTALAVLDIQRALPKARVVYASATAATEVSNIAYAERLGLWGEGTPFATIEAFVSKIEAGGIAAMEVVARDMKQMGVYMARGLSYEGVEYSKVEHKLTDDQRAMYDAAATAWQGVLQNVNEAIADHTEGGSRQRTAAMSAFWGAHQRFFSQFLTSMQMPTVLKAMHEDLKNGLSPVVQLVNTNEAATNRALSKVESAEDLENLDITPKEILMQFVENSFPVAQFEEYEDETGNIRTRPVKDSKGNVVQNVEAVAMRDKILDDLASMSLPGNPLDMILEEFGHENVAEITGRSQRFIKKNGKMVRERRSQSKTKAEAAEYMDGKRKILAFSDAGGTGMDFHADKGVKNQSRRAHYILQAGWRADRAIQGFGRTHRTNQVQPPHYKLVGTDLAGHKRFTSSIARRLEQLGALTKGQKDSSSSTMFSAADNLENEYGEDAVRALFRSIVRGDIEGFTAEDVKTQMGINMYDEKGLSETKLPGVTQFLNRLLSVSIDKQNMLFDEFVQRMEDRIQAAIDTGDYTDGVEKVSHQGARLDYSQIAYEDDRTGARSEYNVVITSHKLEPNAFDREARFSSTVFKTNEETGEVAAFRSASAGIDENGRQVARYLRVTPGSRDVISSEDYRFKYKMVDTDEAETLWDKQLSALPATYEQTRHMITGALLPIYDRLPNDKPKIVTIDLDDGQSLLGREISEDMLDSTLQNLGVKGKKIELTSAEIQKEVLGGKSVFLSSGHKLLRRKVNDEFRIEVISPAAAKYSDRATGGPFSKVGMQMERMNYEMRAFIPNGDAGVPVLDRFMSGKDIVNVASQRARRQAGAQTDASRTKARERVTGSAYYKALRAEMDRMGLGRVNLVVDPDMDEQGAFSNDIRGNMQITIGATIAPIETLRHEAVHAFRAMNLFTDAEWAALTKKAERDWIAQFDIKNRYPDLSREEQVEEAVAEAYAAAITSNEPPVAKLLRNAFQKIQKLLKAFGKVLGRVDVSQIFATAEARATAATPHNSDIGYKARFRRQTTTGGTTGAAHIPDRKVWDALMAENVSVAERARDVGDAMYDRLDRARIVMQDRFLPVLRAQQAIERKFGAAMPEELNVYLAEETYSGRTGFKLDKIEQDYKRPILDLIAGSKDMTAASVGEYLYARHAGERNAKIAEINPDMPEGGSGMTDEEAARILSDAHSGPDAERYKEIAVKIDALREWAINERLDHGLMTEIEAKSWARTYKHYVPLKGWAETDHSDAELDVSGTGRGYNTRGQETRRALGRRSEAFNPLIAALTQAEEVAIRTEKNRVGQHLYRLAKDVPSSKLWTIKQVEETRVFNATTGLVETRAVQPLTMMQAANEVAVKVDGKEFRIMLHDPRLARAVLNVGVDRMNAFTRFMSYFSRYFSAINTMLDPEFVIRNAFRDAITATVNMQGRSKDANAIMAAVFKSWPKALAGAYRGLGGKADTEWSKHFEEFSRVGGKVAFWRMDNPEESMADFDKRIKMMKGLPFMPYSKLNTRDNPILSFVERTNLAVDNAVRLAAFVEARKRGWSEAEAASLSKNLTVNFNRRGEAGPTLNAFYPFANAAIQGSHILLKALKSGRVRKVVGGMMVGGFMLDLVNAALSEEDDDGELAYDKIPAWKSEMNMVVMLGPDAGDAATIWLPYGYNVFPYAGQQLGKVVRGKMEWDDALLNLANATFGAFSPLGGENALSFFTPTLLDPIAEMTMNENWLGRPIRPENPYADYGPDSEKYFANVSTVSRWLARQMNTASGGSPAESGIVDVSPEYLDHTFQFMFGGAGRFFGRASDLMTKIYEGDTVESRDVPLARSLYMDTEGWLDREAYYRRRDEIKEAMHSAETYVERNEPVPAHVRRLAKLEPILKETDKLIRKGNRAKRQDGINAEQRKGIESGQQKAYTKLNRAYLRAMQN